MFTLIVLSTSIVVTLPMITESLLYISWTLGWLYVHTHSG